jgi:hypothetical protein
MMAQKTNRQGTIKTELQVNGTKVELKGFVQRFLGQAVIGMVQSLRGIDEVQTIQVKICSVETDVVDP